MKKIISILIVLLGTVTCWAQSWTAPDPGKYETSTIINFDLMVNGELVSDRDDVKVGAFINNECRGIVTANSSHATVTGGKEIVYTHFMVYGNQSDIDKNIELRVRFNGLDYVLADETRRGYKFDGETQGTLSQLKHFSMLDLKECELSMPDINLHVTDNRESEAVEKLLEVVRRHPLSGEVQQRVKFDDLICRPVYSYLSISNGDPYFTVIRGYDYLSHVKAFKSTGRLGETMKITFNVPYWDVMTTTCQVRIAPLDYLDEDVRMRVDDITLQKGESVDLREKVHFLIPTEAWTEKQPVYDDVRYEDLFEHLGYETHMLWGIDPNISEYYEWDPSDYRLTAIKNTNEVGIPLSVTVDFEDKDIVLTENTRVYIEPFDYFDDRATLIFDDIEICKGETVDLRDYAFFFFPRTGEFVSFHDLHERFDFVPDFLSRGPYAYCCKVEGFSLTGKIFQTREPVSICFYTEDEAYSYWGQVYVTVRNEEYYVAIEDLQFELPEVLHRFETVTVPVSITPSNARFTQSQFTFTDTSRIGYGPAGWESADCRIVSAGDGWNLEITPLVFGPINLKCVYSYADHKIELTRNFSVPVEQPLKAGWGWYTFYAHDSDFTVESLDNDLFGGTILDIRTQDALNYKDENYGFYGDLHNLKSIDCVKVKSLALSDTKHYYPLALTEPVSLQHPTAYSVDPGWNWIGYPYQYSHPLRTIENFLPKADGTRLATFTSGFAECDGGYWISSIDAIPFGEGIMLYNPTDEILSFTLPAEKTLPQPDFASPDAGSNHRAPEGGCHFSLSDYPNNMTIVAVLADDYDAEGLTVAPFVGRECRGTSRVVSTDSGQWLFITAYGKPGERLTFHLLDGYDEYPLAENLTFASAAGSLRHPVVFQLPEALNGVTAVHADQSAPSDIYDLSGRRLGSSLSHGLYIQGGKVVFVE